MDRIRDLANVSIRRGCGFGLLAIATAMVGMAYDVGLAVRMGAIGVSLMVAVLLLLGVRAPQRSYKDTETWILMDRRHDLPEARAQQVIGNILRDCYFHHATLIGSAAGLLWILAYVLFIFGRDPDL